LRWKSAVLPAHALLFVCFTKSRDSFGAGILEKVRKLTILRYYSQPSALNFPRAKRKSPEDGWTRGDAITIGDKKKRNREEQECQGTIAILYHDIPIWNSRDWGDCALSALRLLD